MNKTFLFTALIAFGAFVACAAFANAWCVDSDGGINYFVYGLVNASNVTNATGCAQYPGFYLCGDYCTYPSNVLTEFYCNAGVGNRVNYACANGCLNGACLNANATPTPTYWPSPSPNATNTPYPSPNATITPTPTANASATPRPSPTPTVRPSPRPTVKPTKPAAVTASAPPQESDYIPYLFAGAALCLAAAAYIHYKKK